MNNKFKITIAFLSFLMIISCIWNDDDYDTLEIPVKTNLTDKEIKVFKSTDLKLDTFYVKVNYGQYGSRIEKEYYEICKIYYLNEYIDHISPYDSIESFLILQDFELLNIKKMTEYNLDGVFIGGVYYADDDSKIINNFDSYQQNGHIYPDVYTFEMDMVTAMENWDTTMNLFPDLRKVWYSLSRGIVRYDMKDGESFRLVE